MCYIAHRLISDNTATWCSLSGWRCNLQYIHIQFFSLDLIFVHLGYSIAVRRRDESVHRTSPSDRSVCFHSKMLSVVCVRFGFFQW